MLPIMRSATVALAAGAALCMPGSPGLHAQYSKSFSFVGTQKFGVELDSGDKRRSEWFQEDVKPFSAFRALCTALRIGSGAPATFAFEIYFAEPLKQNAKGYSLYLSTDSDKSPMTVGVRYWDVAKKKYEVAKQFNKKINVNERFLVELIWTDKKMRFAVSDTESYDLILPQAVKELYISATTGNMRCSAAMGTATF
jgi:hypothetical protein